MSSPIQLDGPYISRRAQRRAFALAVLGWLLICVAAIACYAGLAMLTAAAV